MILAAIPDDLWGLCVLGGLVALGLLGKWVPGLDDLLFGPEDRPDLP